MTGGLENKTQFSLMLFFHFINKIRLMSIVQINTVPLFFFLRYASWRFSLSDKLPPLLLLVYCSAFAPLVVLLDKMDLFASAKLPEMRDRVM